jgi:hypothetical protein
LHVGNFGQSKADNAFDYNLLYKNAKAPEVKDSETEMKWRANQLPKEQQPAATEQYEKHVLNFFVSPFIRRAALGGA